jgi:hypothetical protein
MSRGAGWPPPLQEHYNYYAVPDNIEALHAFHEQAVRYWFVALRRRSQRTTVTSEWMSRLTDRWLPQPGILHPWPQERFHARPQGRTPVRQTRTLVSVREAGRTPQRRGPSLPATFTASRWEG